MSSLKNSWHVPGSCTRVPRMLTWHLVNWLNVPATNIHYVIKIKYSLSYPYEKVLTSSKFNYSMGQKIPYAYTHVTHFCTCNCGLRKNIVTARSYRWDQQDRRQTTVCLTFDGRLCRHTLRLKLHRFDLSLYLLHCLLYNI